MAQLSIFFCKRLPISSDILRFDYAFVVLYSSVAGRWLSKKAKLLICKPHMSFEIIDEDYFKREEHVAA